MCNCVRSIIDFLKFFLYFKKVIFQKNLPSKNQPNRKHAYENNVVNPINI